MTGLVQCTVPLFLLCRVNHEVHALIYFLCVVSMSDCLEIIFSLIPLLVINYHCSFSHDFEWIVSYFSLLYLEVHDFSLLYCVRFQFSFNHDFE
jgi:hypothetical protein